MKKVLIAASFLLILSACGASPVSQVFTSVKDAFNKSISLRCEYTDTDGSKSVNYIKNKMIRSESSYVSDDKTVNIVGVIRDNKIYVWGDAEADGLVVDMSKITDEGLDMSGTKVKSVDDIISVLEQHKENCQVVNVPDSDFTIPTNIKFQDLSNMGSNTNQ